MAENDIAIQVGVQLDTSDIKSQLEAIGKGKDNQIKVSVDLTDAKKAIKEYKDELKESKSPAKIAIDVLKGQSNTNIGNYVKEIQEKYQTSPIKITLDVDKNATTANINKAVGEMQQQVQKAVDQVAKVNNANTNIVTPGAGVQIIDNNQLRESIKNLEEAEGLAKRITNYSWAQTEDGISSLQATSQIERYNEALGKTVTVYKEIDKEQSKLAGWDIFKETGQSIQENFERVEKLEQQTMNYFSKLQTEYNKMQSSISGQGNPLIGDYAQKATEALEKYRDEYTKVMNAGNGATDAQKRNIEELRQQTLLVIKEQRSLQKAYEDTLITVQKQQNVLETTYAKAFDKNATKTLFFEAGDTVNQKFAEPVIEQYEKIKTLLSDIENNARNNGLAITTEQTNQLTEAFAKLNIVISEQKNARWTATNFKETDTASFVERYRNMMVELSNALKDDGVYDRFQTKISELFATLDSVKSGSASTGDFLNQLRNIKQEINTFESSVKGKGIMAAFDISEDQLVKIKSLGKALSGQENTQGIENLKQKLADLGKAYEELQTKMQAKGISRDRLNSLEAEQKALDKELQSINSMVNNLGNQSWVNSQNAGIADMKAKFAEYREEITKTVQLTPELDQKLKDLAQAMSESGKVDVTNWKDYSNEIKTLKANIEEFKNSLQGKASQLSLGIEANQLEQINDVVNKLNSLDEQYSGAGVDRIKSDFQSLSEEYQKIIDQLQSKDLTDSQFKELSKQADELDQKLKQLVKEAGTFGNQNSFEKFTASANTLKLNLERLESQYSALIAKNPEFAGRVDELRQKLESLRPGEIPIISKEISNLGKEMASASGQTAGLRGALTDAFGGLGSYLARFTSSYYIITKTIQGIKKMVNAVKEVDTSLVELQKVTNLTGDSLAQFTDKAYQMGAQLGRTGKDVIDAATTFSRAGYSLNEATQLAQSALVMTNVGVDIPNMESAASDMISILKAFDKQAEESMDVIDKLYNVANKEPLDFGNITQMLVTAGGTLAQSGSSLEETMGLLTGAFATMRSPAVANG